MTLASLRSRKLLALLALGWVGLLAGCGTQPVGGDAPAEWHTASDDTDARKRARTRLALATGYLPWGHGD